MNIWGVTALVNNSLNRKLKLVTKKIFVSKMEVISSQLDTRKCKFCSRILLSNIRSITSTLKVFSSGGEIIY
jgi:hypothetical protein